MFSPLRHQRVTGLTCEARVLGEVLHALVQAHDALPRRARRRQPPPLGSLPEQHAKKPRSWHAECSCRLTLPSMSQVICVPCPMGRAWGRIGEELLHAWRASRAETVEVAVAGDREVVKADSCALAAAMRSRGAIDAAGVICSGTAGDTTAAASAAPSSAAGVAVAVSASAQWAAAPALGHALHGEAPRAVQSCSTMHQARNLFN